MIAPTIFFKFTVSALEKRSKDKNFDKKIQEEKNYINLSQGRYRIEKRLSVTETSTAKIETKKNTYPETQLYSNAIQNLINNTKIRVKIADLGNACYDVSENK